jgi:hypothetical protein
MEKWKFLTLPGLEPRPLSRPARSQSLYRLRYRGQVLIATSDDELQRAIYNLQKTISGFDTSISTEKKKTKIKAFLVKTLSGAKFL